MINSSTIYIYDFTEIYNIIFLVCILELSIMSISESWKNCDNKNIKILNPLINY